MYVSRNPYLIGKALKNFLLASILTMSVQQLNVTIDGIIVSHFVGPDALSATSLYMPVSLAVSSLVALFGMGATIIASRYLGELNRDKAERTLSTAVLSVIAVGVFLGGISLLCGDSIVSLLCHEERISAPFKSYLTVMLGCSAITMFGMVTNQMVNIDGHPEHVTKAMLVSAIANLTLDLLFVAVFKWSIAGSAWATILSTILSSGLLWSHLLSYRCSFRIRPFKFFSLDCLKTNMLQGASLVAGNLILMLMFATLNNIIQDKQGADGMFAFAICVNLLTIGMAFTSGIGSALMSIGGFLNGQRDYQGLRMLVNRGIALLEISLLVIVFVIQLFPGLVSGLFGADTAELQLFTNSVLRIFSWILPCVLLVILLSNVYQLLGKLILVPVSVLTFPLVLIPSLLLWAGLAGNGNIWYAFPQTGVTVLLFTLVITGIVRRKEPYRQRLTLVPDICNRKILDFSVKADKESMTEALPEITKFLATVGIDPVLSNDVNLCVEEVMLNIVEHSGRTGARHYFDVNISLSDDTVIASVKDDGRAFNPVKCSEAQKGNGLKILHNFCPDIEYKYMYGQNITFMKWQMN